jgi:uncharacterized membrane protein YciS (DUF1049 family)
MTDAPALAESAPPERVNAEQWIYDVSPFGTFLTTALVFLVAVASFAGALAVEHIPLRDPHGRVLGLEDTVWPAFVLSLMLAAVLGIQRYARQKNQSDLPDYARVFRRTGPAPVFLTPYVRVRLAAATVAGVLVGAGLMALTLSKEVLSENPLVTGWFFVVESAVSMLFARGIVMSARNAQLYSDAIRNDLVIDLLRIDGLAVIGRNGARTAFIWFTVAAVICLFFVGDNMAVSTFLTVLFAAGMGLWIFMQPMMQVHRRIRAAKTAELDRLRAAIADLRTEAFVHGDAAAWLHGLLAYEKRIEDVREWPFDQTTALRLSAYILIPAIPWFGQAMAQYFVERVAQ